MATEVSPSGRRVLNVLISPESDRLVFWGLFSISCLFSLSSMDYSSYFLHWDVASQHVAALDLLKGCWGYDAGKPLIMWLLTLPFGLVIASPVLETVLLSLLAGLSAGLFYVLARHALSSRAWALGVTLWFMSWPTSVYYSRIHLGYAIVLLLVALVAYTRYKYFLGGLVMGLAILAYPGMLLACFAWIGVHWFVTKDHRLSDLFSACFGLGAALVFMELVRFVYTGEPFGWWVGQLADIRAYATSSVDQRWSHVLESFWILNGPIHSVIVVIGLSSFALTSKAKRNPCAQAAFLTGVLVLGSYFLRTALGLAGFNTRLMAGASPMLAIAAVAGISSLIGRARWTIPRLASGSLAAIAFGAMLSNSFVEAGSFSRTAYPNLEQAFVRAGSLGVPVRYFGQPYPALFFGLKHNVETLANWSDMGPLSLKELPSVVVVEAQSQPEAELTWEILSTSVSERYDSLIYLNPAASYRIRAIEEEFFPSTELLWSIASSSDKHQPVLAIWTPRYTPLVEPSTFANAGVVPYHWLSYYYHGDGDCQITPRGHPYSYRYYRYLFQRWKQIIGIEI